MPFVHQYGFRFRIVVFALLVAATGVATTACSGRESRAAAASDTARSTSTLVARTIRDDFGDTLTISASPRRVVSLNPATTELFFALGAGDRLVGRTHYDLYPVAAKAVPDLGNGMQPNVEAVLGARPDLVVLYASNDNRDAARRFRAAGVPTLTLRVDRIAEFRHAVTILGQVLADTAAALTVVDSVEATLDRVRSATRGLKRPTAFWKAWDSPVIAIGGGSFLTELVDVAGGSNIYGDDPRPSLDVTIEDVVRRDPDVVLAGPESAQRMRAAPAWRALRAVREGRVLIVDTTLVGRPGVRLGEAAMSLAQLMHPGAVK
ncbi:MAG TPA: helical backbone metal receptor [Gemmatimonadaceae bacterium]|nr:helical backbone metal receptor [Gemmatimonadaceae bacterium]